MARTDLEQLQFSMAADITLMQKQLKKALDQVNSTSDQIDKRLKKTGEGVNLGKALDAIFDRSRLAMIDEGGARLSVFGSALEFLGPAGIAAAAAIAALGVSLESAEKALEYADAIYKTAQNAHVSTDALQEYQFAVRAVGGDQAKAGEALASFSAMLGKAQAGFPRAIKAFQALGFPPDVVKSWGSAEQALPIVAEAIANLKNKSQQDAAISMTGLDGLKLLIEQGPDKMRELAAEAQATGNVMDSAVVQRGHELNEEMEKLKGKISTELTTAFVGLGPILVGLTKLLAGMAGWVQKIVDAFQELEGKSDQGLKDTAAGLLQHINKDEAAQSRGAPVDQKHLADLKNQLADVYKELARRAQAAQPPKPGGDGSLDYPGRSRGPSAADKLAKGEEALDQAQKDVLAAEAALTDNLDELVALKTQEVDRETDKKNKALQRQIDDGKIDAVTAKEAILANDHAADLQKDKIRRDAQEKLEDQYFAVQQKVGAIYDSIAATNASIADTIQARLQIERAALLQRQKEEREALQREFDRQKAHGDFDQSRADMQTAAMRDQQSSQLAGLEDSAARDLGGDFRTYLGGAVDALRNKQDVMHYLADAFGQRLLDNWVDVISKLLAQASNDAPAGSFLATIGSVFGHRAAGGGVTAGLPYQINEMGAGSEVFVPGVSGTILPIRAIAARLNGGARGGAVVNMNINAPGSMMAQEFIDFVQSSKNEAIRVATFQGAAAAAAIVPSRMAKASRQAYRR